MSWLEDLRRELEPIGLNAWGVADGRSAGALLPDCRAVVVIGSGGPGLWEAFSGAVAREPHRLRTPHPLDTFVEECLRQADPNPPPSRRWIRCAATEPVMVDFRALGLAAGLGYRSRLGLLLHPLYGPWLGLRAAVLTTDELSVTGPLLGESPCVRCNGPCERACPVGAVSTRGWDLERCQGHRRATQTCAGTCHARRACPVGVGWQYPAEEEAFHMGAWG